MQFVFLTLASLLLASPIPANGAEKFAAKALVNLKNGRASSASASASTGAGVRSTGENLIAEIAGRSSSNARPFALISRQVDTPSGHSFDPELPSLAEIKQVRTHFQSNQPFKEHDPFSLGGASLDETLGNIPN